MCVLLGEAHHYPRSPLEVTQQLALAMHVSLGPKRVSSTIHSHLLQLRVALTAPLAAVLT